MTVKAHGICLSIEGPNEYASFNWMSNGDGQPLLHFYIDEGCGLFLDEANVEWLVSELLKALATPRKNPKQLELPFGGGQS
jgi:hypothetical protein